MQNELHQQRLAGQQLAPAFKAKGWRRDIYNNEFIKGDKAAYFSGEYLIFHFHAIQWSGNYCNSFHRLKIFSNHGI